MSPHHAPTADLPSGADSLSDPDDSPEEPTPAEPQAPEVPQGMETVAAWDEPPAASGVRIAPVPPEDEEVSPSSLVTEGIEEAERELRLAANTESEEEPADPDASADYPTSGILS